MVLKKIIGSDIVFGVFAAVFILSLAIAVRARGGKDLKVGLFGVEQVLQKKSPYENPTDPNRAIFRYAPGFTILQYPFLLKSKLVAPFQFENIVPSALAWYFVSIAALSASILILFKLIPARSRQVSLRNIKLSLLMASPLIGYELANGQNKIIALFFMLLAIFLFERNKLFASAIFFSLALTVYISLLTFIFYFILRSKGRFLISFILAALIVFFIAPSLVFGLGFNVYLLKEWFLRSLKPFFFTHSYVTYIDLRDSSQSLPSAIGRIFVSGKTGHFNYLISPSAIHVIVRVFSFLITLVSCIAAWGRPKEFSKGLGYALFLVLALILPQYCIYYTWAWLFVFYFAVFNYISYPQVPYVLKKSLFALVAVSYLSVLLIGIHSVNYHSFIFWATLFLWSGMAFALIKGTVTARPE